MASYVLRIDELQAGPGGGYPVTLYDASAPNASLAVTVIPENVQPAVGASLSTADMLEKISEQDSADPAFEQMGAQLYGLLMGGGIEAALDQRLQPGDRVMLDVRPEALRRLPWEIMLNGPLAVFLDQQNPWSRGNLLRPPALEPIELPLRVLVIVGCKPDDQKVFAEDEVAALVDAIRDVEPQVDLWVERRPSREWIKQRFAPGGLQPHVVHFIGHGDVAANKGLLRLCVRTSEGSADCVDTDWDAGTIANDFKNLPSKPRLVILNACRSGGASDRGLKFSVADAFLLAGVPAVISMGGDVTGAHAIAFARELYHTLASSPDPLPLDVAVARARDAVFNQRTPPLEYRDWALPMLDLRAPPDQIIQVPRSSDELRLEVQKAPFYRDRLGYVDRRERRSEMWTTLRGPKPTSEVLVITGEIQSGKSALAHLLVERCLIAGHEARYVSFAGKLQLTALDFLRGIIKGEAFANNDSRLNQRVPGPAAEAFLAHVAALDPRALEDADTSREVLRLFQEALVAASQAAPLVIVADQLEGLPASQFTSLLRDQLLNWRAPDLKQPIRLVLIVNNQQQVEWKLEGATVLTTPLFSVGEWSILIEEFVRRFLALKGSVPTAAQRSKIETFMQGLAPTPDSQGFWKPDLFIDAASLVTLGLKRP